jgi:steroid delta-isomerase-like uncharacterized protein
MPINSQSAEGSEKDASKVGVRKVWNSAGFTDLEENKEAYRKFIELAFNEGKLDQLDKVLTADYVYQDAPLGTPPGQEAIRQVVTMFRHAFPDFKITFEDQIAERDMVCSRTITTGTHKGEIFGLKPTGNSFRMPGITWVRIAEGKVAESWVENDVQSLMKQLGAK